MGDPFLINRIVLALERHEIVPSNEAELQEAVASLLARECEVEVSREVELSARDRIDLMAGDVGIECKVDGTQQEVLRQLLRYAESPRVKSLVLVTTRRKHRTAQRTLGGKPCRVVCVGGIG